MQCTQIIQLGLHWFIKQYSVNHHPYYFLFMQFFYNHISDPYFTSLNLQFFAPLGYVVIKLCAISTFCVLW